MKDIFSSIRNRINSFFQSIAQAIDDGDWKTLACNVGIASAIVVCVIVALFTLLALVAKFFGTFLGKLLIAPAVLYLLGLSYKVNLEDSRTSRKQISDSANLEAWAENVYAFVRDAMFMFLRAMSDYTAVVRPTSPGSVELPNGISIRDGYVVFSFFARVSANVDVPQLKRELTRTLGQMLRAHELPGIASDLVLVNGSYYCPLQVLDVIDLGDSINISVVFSTEKTVEVVHARKMLNLEKRELRARPKDTLYDDKL